MFTLELTPEQRQQKQLTWNHLSEEQKLELRPELYRWLMSHRLSNYGYDYKGWRQLQNQKYRAKKKLRSHWCINTENRYGIYDRLTIAPNDNPHNTYESYQVDYITGQSFNEELITLLECFGE